MTATSGALIDLGDDFDYANANLTTLNEAMSDNADLGETSLADYLNKNAQTQNLYRGSRTESNYAGVGGTQTISDDYLTVLGEND